MKFEKFADYLEKLEKTSSRLAITEVLVEMIKDFDGDEVEKGVYLTLGQLGPDYDKKDFGMAIKIVLRSVAKVVEKGAEEVEKEYKKVGDVGDYLAKVYVGRGKGKSIGFVYDALWEIASLGGEGSQERKVDRLVELLESLSSTEGKFVVRMVLGKLRIGFSAKTIFDALSVLESGGKGVRKEFDAVYQIYPDVGHIVSKFLGGGLMALKKIKVKTTVPVVSALCQRLNEYDEVIKKMGVVGVERKYDGSRVQIHFKRDSRDIVRTYTRNLEESSAMFPELLRIGELVEADEIVLDSEAVGYDRATGKILPFQVTITRKRKHGIEEAAESVPLKFFVFDILSLNGESLLEKPYHERREFLKRVIKKNEILVIDEVKKTDKSEEVEMWHDQFLKEGFEGAVIKKWDGEYLPGRQGWNWVKIKEAEGSSGKLSDTLDLVILGYYFGRGKRTDFGMGAFLVGTKKGERYVSLAKIGTGLTDEEFRGLTARLEKNIITEKAKNVEVEGSLVPDVWVSPKVVVEIAADEITKSPSHAGGVALRFPRLIKFRDDKGPEQVTTWEEVLRIGNI